MAFIGRYQQVTEEEVFKYLASTQELCLKISGFKMMDRKKFIKSTRVYQTPNF